MKRVVSLALAFLLIVPFAQSAVVHGIVYDMGLQPAQNVILKVNSVPEQTFVARDGSYSFTLPRGDYRIWATSKIDYMTLTAEQNITIMDEGDYLMDIILFQDISEEEQLLNDNISIATLYPEEPANHGPFLAVAGAVVIIAAILFWFWKGKKKTVHAEADDMPKEMIGFIKQEGGRVTQKDIRKHFPVSEAKVSLVITELEHKGEIKKIKKGKGNVIIMNRR
jgi:uncharacterized membrane protein